MSMYLEINVDTWEGQPRVICVDEVKIKGGRPRGSSCWENGWDEAPEGPEIECKATWKDTGTALTDADWERYQETIDEQILQEAA